MVLFRFFVLVFFVNVVFSSVLPGYKLQNVTNTNWGYEGDLVRESSGPYGGDIDNLKLFVYFQTQNILRVKIIDPNNERWEVPDVVQIESPPKSSPSATSYKVSFTYSPFGISVFRSTDNQMIWNTTSPQSGNQFNGLIVCIFTKSNQKTNYFTSMKINI